MLCTSWRAISTRSPGPSKAATSSIPPARRTVRLTASPELAAIHRDAFDDGEDGAASREPEIVDGAPRQRGDDALRATRHGYCRLGRAGLLDRDHVALQDIERTDPGWTLSRDHHVARGNADSQPRPDRHIKAWHSDLAGAGRESGEAELLVVAGDARLQHGARLPGLGSEQVKPAQDVGGRPAGRDASLIKQYERRCEPGDL